MFEWYQKWSQYHSLLAQIFVRKRKRSDVQTSQKILQMASKTGNFPSKFGNFTSRLRIFSVNFRSKWGSFRKRKCHKIKNKYCKWHQKQVSKIFLKLIAVCYIKIYKNFANSNFNWNSQNYIHHTKWIIRSTDFSGHLQGFKFW